MYSNTPKPDCVNHHVKIPKPTQLHYDSAALVAKWHSFKTLNSTHYLVSRGLNFDTINVFSERIRIDDRGNTLFRHDDYNGLTGWEIKNKNFTGFAVGGRKSLFACRV